MTETNNNQNDQPTEEQQSFNETHADLREISQKDLERILIDHQRWLESDKKEGSQADLSKANLQKANLFKVNLQKANLSETNLEETNFARAILLNANLFKANLQQANCFKANMQLANLFEVNLQQASLFGADLSNTILAMANLKDANLTSAHLQNANCKKADMQNTVLDSVRGLSTANLKYANMQGATGLLGNEFAQADVTGTKLPDDIKEFKALETVEKTSQNARKIFFAMLLGCVYSWLTIATTTDVRLLTNTASSPLPIIGTEIPIAGFYFAAPLVLICLYFYFHLYLDNLWKGLAGLPAIFPDGKPLDQTAYPWLLNSIVCRHFKRLKKRPWIAHLKEWITIFLAWWVVPITMIAFWLRYIPRHDWFGTYFHIGLIVVSVAFGIIFYRLCALTLQGKEKSVIRLKYFWKDRRFYYGVSVVVVGIVFSLLSYGAIKGERPIIIPKSYGNPLSGTPGYIFDIKSVVPFVFGKIGYNVFADFYEKDLSKIPANYSVIDKVERLEFIKGAKLKNANLSNANMAYAFLTKADMRESNLQNADLSYAYLQNADLRDSNLQNADLSYAYLQNADLRETNLQNANLSYANLQNANFFIADLQKANLFRADVQNADLHDAYLQNAVLSHANLQNADFGETNLQNVNFSTANLQNAILKYADLTGAKNLTVEQLSKVKTLYKAKLDPELMEQVKKCCPQLLEKPKEEPEETK